MFGELDKYLNNGHFFFKKGDMLQEVSKDVPNLPGVYYILRLAKGRVDIIYIGKSGTIKQDGTFKEQGLRKRLNNKQNSLERETYFNLKIEEEEIDGLDIYWFVTVDKNTRDLPGYIEGLIMQIFFEVHNKLPDWNKEY